ncbi:MAG: hypothetical protein Q4E73_04720 [Lachnospiraceae bacterium]|nr:hypothetical protein [Lachnospiraceae bacterium]
MKKIITILLCTLIAGTLLTGCGNQSSDANNLKITWNDVTLELPESWTDRYITEESDNALTVYHKASNESWKKKNEEGFGVLFTLNYSEDDSYTVLPSYDDLGKSKNGGYYYIVYPTDVQAYVSDEKIQDEYDSMYKEIDYIKEHASLK